MKKSLLLVAVTLAVAPGALAQPFRFDPDTRDQVAFGVSRKATVQNDEMTVTLAATHSELKAAVAADAVNEAMQAALERVRRAEGVEFRTGSYSTNQIHPRPPAPARPNDPRWRVEQELILASGDFETLRALVTDLQASLNLKSVGFALSPARRVEEEANISDAVLRAFGEEAERIRKTLGFAGYEIVELHLSGGTQDPLQHRSRYATMALEVGSMGDVAPVVLEGGSSDVIGNVQARIQLLR